jgi:site-specific DNA-cytosine methylase
VLTHAIERQSTLARLYNKSFGIVPGTDVRTNVDEAAPLAPARSVAIQLVSFECHCFSQAGAQAGLSDKETAETIDQVFVRLKLEQPDGVLLENVRGLSSLWLGAMCCSSCSKASVVLVLCHCSRSRQPSVHRLRVQPSTPAHHGAAQ